MARRHGPPPDAARVLGTQPHTPRRTRRQHALSAGLAAETDGILTAP